MYLYVSDFRALTVDWVLRSLGKPCSWHCGAMRTGWVREPPEKHASLPMRAAPQCDGEGFRGCIQFVTRRIPRAEGWLGSLVGCMGVYVRSSPGPLSPLECPHTKRQLDVVPSTSRLQPELSHWTCEAGRVGANASERGKALLSWYWG
jgi:hypothetical protein